ncbi:MAG TPA: HAD-IA family hydrolase [Actinomycetales bacterium]|uniref:HAD family hydrolase n=1 Tax=uncultured Corynebacterium sp. TaxID=159447 RepID=UPI0017777ED7|nr:HAD-IA family hydrolase [uncultured Corynebacterium sp.]HHU45489.1 HAD-IA family hydrolase [Actinomycetales bacterium]
MNADAAANRDLASFGAVLFDLDGVITPTADIHEAAWGDMFRAFLEERGAEPYADSDYFEHLDGRRRDEGIAAMLASRGIELPYGSDADTAQDDTITGLGLRKNEDFLARVAAGVEPYEGSVRLLDVLADAAAAGSGPKLAIVSSSRNARPVLEAAGLLDRFELIVDGNVAHELELSGKPAPDTYVHAAEALGVPAAEAVVVEDAISGVQSGAAGDFGLVVGVDRGAGRDALANAGADVVVDDLGELIR